VKGVSQKKIVKLQKNEVVIAKSEVVIAKNEVVIVKNEVAIAKYFCPLVAEIPSSSSSPSQLRQTSFGLSSAGLEGIMGNGSDGGGKK
jgi:hypothetical protein